MKEQLISEIRKSISMTSWRVLVFGTVILSGAICSGLTAIGAFVEITPVRLDNSDHLQATVGAPLTMLFSVPVIIGILLVTSEYQSGTISQTLIANPRRGQVFLAKVLWAGLTGLLIGLLTVILSLGGMLAVLVATGHSTSAFNWGVVGTGLSAILVMMLWTMAGAGIGAAVREQLIAIIAIIVISQVIEPMLLLTGIEQLDYILPATMTDAATGGGLLSLIAGTEPISKHIALAVLGFVSVLAVLVGFLRFLRHEPA